MEQGPLRSRRLEGPVEPIIDVVALEFGRDPRLGGEAPREFDRVVADVHAGHARAGGGDTQRVLTTRPMDGSSPYAT
jgi:hypothetical protein